MQTPHPLATPAPVESMARPFVRRRTWPRALGSTLLASSLLFTGCTSSKYKKVSAKIGDPGPALINAPLGGDPVTTTLNTVIVYKGRGSWKKEAFWDEYALTLRNESADTVTIDHATLLDLAGTGHEAGVNPWALEAQSKSLERKYADAGVAFARYAGPVAVMGAVSVGAAYATTASLLGGAAGSTAAASASVASAAFIPVYLVTVVSINHSRKRGIEREFDRRRLHLPLTLAPGEACSGSLFFPMIPSPQALTLSWRKPDGSGTMRSLLPMLSALHLDPAKKSRQRAPESAPGTAVAAGSP